MVEGDSSSAPVNPTPASVSHPSTAPVNREKRTSEQIRSIRSSALLFILITAAVFLLHLPLLRLPYFWDEAGYYIPAARDLLTTGSLIPHSVPSNAHPPLVMAYLAACWKLVGFSSAATRSAMLFVAAIALLGVFRLALRVSTVQVAIAAMVCTALYPVFFAQSSMALLDLAAAGLTLWGLNAYLAGSHRSTAVWFSLAVLAKETAILAPLALLVWDIACPRIHLREGASICPERSRQRILSLTAPVAVLCCWYFYHYAQTGYVFGNPEFFRYNVQTTRNPIRIMLALGMRLWQLSGYLHLWLLTGMMAWALTRPPVRDKDGERQRISFRAQAAFGAVIIAYLLAMSLVGGAVLARYMLPAIPLVIILAVSTLRRRVQHWPACIAIVCVAFLGGLFWNPPYGFSPEDNLAYRDYVVMHQHAEHFLESRFPSARVLTAWPASDEISRPYLGYVTHSMRVVRIENFTAEEVLAAAEQSVPFDVALVFSTKYEPPQPLLSHWIAWERIKSRFFGFHRDLPPEIAAPLLRGEIVFRESRIGQWVAVIRIERNEEALRAESNGHQVAGMSLDDEPYFPSGRKFKEIAGGEREMHFEFNSTIHTRRNDDVPPRNGNDFAGQHVARAQPLGRPDSY